MTANLWYIFSAFIVLVILQVWMVYQISSYPASAHKLKRKWTGIVLSFPLFGMLIYFIVGRSELRASKND